MFDSAEANCDNCGASKTKLIAVGRSKETKTLTRQSRPLTDTGNKTDQLQCTAEALYFRIT